MKNKNDQRLRKKVEHLLIDTGLSRSLKKIADEMGVNYSSLSMARTGYRSQPHSRELLERLRDYLENKRV